VTRDGILILFGLLGPLLAGGAAEYFASPQGQPGGDGTRERPWDLPTALGPGSRVGAGDTLWLLGGSYQGNFASYLTGASNQFITVRGHARERVTIDGASPDTFPLKIEGAWTIYRDFEVTHSTTAKPGAPTPVAVQCVAPHIKLVNLIIHDAGQGIGSWMGATENEIYGCLIYHNGADAQEHGIYIQNDARTGTKRVHDNIIFNNSGFGVHAYTRGGQLTGLDFQGNICFNNGAKSGEATRYDNLFVGGSPPADQIMVVSNYTYFSPGASRFNLRFSYGDHAANPHGSIVVRDNIIWGGTGFTADDWRDISFSNNLIASATLLTHCSPPGGVLLSSYRWNANRYHGTSAFGVGKRIVNFREWQTLSNLDGQSSHSAKLPAGTLVVVRPNRYEPKRAHIVVCNWDRLDNVQADLSSVLHAGDRFEIRNAQDFLGGPVLRSTYRGVPVSLPMTNLSVARPAGRASGLKATGPFFNVFMVRGADGPTETRP
jgi:hypothetical protein